MNQWHGRETILPTALPPLTKATRATMPMAVLAPAATPSPSVCIVEADADPYVGSVPAAVGSVPAAVGCAAADNGVSRFAEAPRAYCPYRAAPLALARPMGLGRTACKRTRASVVNGEHRRVTSGEHGLCHVAKTGCAMWRKRGEMLDLLPEKLLPLGQQCWRRGQPARQPVRLDANANANANANENEMRTR